MLCVPRRLRVLLIILTGRVSQKEERVHDEKVANANGKIKQAGLNYEKRVKKNPADAVDEHARYISILTTLGTETNQEK